MGTMLEKRPIWFNDPASDAIGPHGTQVGATCGLHAVIHLLEPLRMQRGCYIPAPSRKIFEKCGLEQNIGDDTANLIQTGGSNYDFGILHANRTAFTRTAFR